MVGLESRRDCLGSMAWSCGCWVCVGAHVNDSSGAFASASAFSGAEQVARCER